MCMYILDSQVFLKIIVTKCVKDKWLCNLYCMCAVLCVSLSFYVCLSVNIPYLQVADALTQCRPVAGSACHLYLLNMRLTGRITDDHNTRGRVIHAPEDTPQTLGILLSKEIPQVCSENCERPYLSSWVNATKGQIFYALIDIFLYLKATDCVLHAYRCLMSGVWSMK